MIVSIHQPDYIPYLGLFYKVSRSERFVFLDDAQYSNDNVHNWNRIKTPQGECRLTVPVEQHLGDLICNVRTRDELQWKEKHLKTLKMNYSQAKYFNEIFPVFEEKLMHPYNSLAEMNMAISTWLFKEFGFKAEIFKSSDMPIKTFREERVLDICKMMKADTYISGHGASSYQVTEHFTNRGINLVYTDYHPIQYKQLWNKRCGFLENMSVLDYIFNCGFDWEYISNAVHTQQAD